MRTILVAGFAVLILCGFVYRSASSPFPQDSPKEKKSTASKDAKAESKPSVEPEKKKKGDEALGPMAVFADIEHGWKKEKSDRILRHYGKGKVSIAIDGIGPKGGAFSKNQSHYLLRDLFKYTITEKFEFVQYRNVTDGRRQVFAVAERHFKRNDDGRLFKDKIYVSLQREGKRWVINEIKSVR